MTLIENFYMLRSLDVDMDRLDVGSGVLNVGGKRITKSIDLKRVGKEHQKHSKRSRQ